MAFKACVRRMSLTELRSNLQYHNNYTIGEALFRAVCPIASTSVWLR
jgi:hypothetical protein